MTRAVCDSRLASYCCSRRVAYPAKNFELFVLVSYVINVTENRLRPGLLLVPVRRLLPEEPTRFDCGEECRGLPVDGVSYIPNRTGCFF